MFVLLLAWPVLLASERIMNVVVSKAMVSEHENIKIHVNEFRSGVIELWNEVEC